jgi:restriction endonuclease S subunit
VARSASAHWLVFRFFQSPEGLNHLIGRTAGVGRPNLNAPSIEGIAIPLPPEDEIPEILESVDDQLSSSTTSKPTSTPS